MTYTVETVRQALLDQGLSALLAKAPVTDTPAEALLYITLFNRLETQGYLEPAQKDYLHRTVQGLQMFGDSFVVSLVEDIADRPGIGILAQLSLGNENLPRRY